MSLMNRSLAYAAQRLGVTSANLRIQIKNGKFTAERHSFGWLTSDEEIERYAKETLGRKGRKKANP